MKAGKRYRGILDAAQRHMARWHVEEEKKSPEPRAVRMRDALSQQGGGWGKYQDRCSLTKSRKEAAARGVARHQADC